MYKQIPNYSDYYINEYGDILSYVSASFLNPQKTCSGGYKVVALINDDGKKIFERVHRLVASTFLPKINGKNHVNHIDYNKINNHVSNLEWCTPQENLIHSYKSKTRGRSTLNGSQLHNSILTEESVIEIRKLRASGVSATAICRIYNIKTISHVCDIVAKRKWKHVV